MPKSITITRLMVLNRDIGGFRLTPLAAREFAKRKGLPFIDLNEKLGSGHYAFGDKYEQLDEVCQRDDPDLVAVIQELGDEASHRGTAKVGEVEITLDISDKFGFEDVHVYGQFQVKK